MIKAALKIEVNAKSFDAGGQGHRRSQGGGGRLPPNCVATNKKFVAQTASGFQNSFQIWFVA